MTSTTRIKDKLKEMSERREKATPGPWSYDFDENEIHSDSMQDFCGDPAHICEMLTPRRIDNAAFIAASRTEHEKLTRAVELLIAALSDVEECLADGSPTRLIALLAFDKVAEILEDPK